MLTIREIKQAVSHLRPDELSDFRTWFEAFDPAAWGKQFEEDVKLRQLDQIAEQAIENFRKGTFKAM